MERRFSGVEVRSAGRTLTGPALVYADVSPTHKERFTPGSFSDLGDRTHWLDIEHDKTRLLAWTGAGLELRDSPEALMVTAILPVTPLHDAALRQVRDGLLRGFSIEFHAREERRKDGVRVVSSALLDGIGLVKNPSFQQSTAEIRRGGGFRLSGRIPLGKSMTCKCHRGTCDRVSFADDAFDESLADEGRDVLLITGTFDSAMASKNVGSLRMTKTDGALKVEADLPATMAADDLAANAKNVSLLTRPVFDQNLSKFVEKDGVAHYSRVRLKAVLVGASDVAGWPAAKIIGKSARRSARRIWL